MKCQITSVGSGRGFIFVGDDAGRIHFLNRRMEVQTVKMFEGNVEQILQVCIYGESALRGFAFFQKHSSFQKVLILQYFTIFIGVQWGQRIAMTTIDTKTFFIIILTIWTLIKSIA